MLVWLVVGLLSWWVGSLLTKYSTNWTSLIPLVLVAMILLTIITGFFNYLMTKRLAVELDLSYQLVQQNIFYTGLISFVLGTVVCLASVSRSLKKQV